ncbi:MAG: FtsX-like permease family protein [Promethearchaeota archaeon]
MFQKFSFNVKQAIFNVKRSLMTIITLALAISMIAGLFYYFDAFEREALRSSSQFDMFSDINLVHTSSTQELNCSNTFDITDADVYSSLSNAELEIETQYRYQTISSLGSLSSSLYANHTNRPDLTSQGLREMETVRFHAFQLDTSFYQSNRFSSFFEIKEGRAPQSKNEILIDMMVAAKFDYSVGSVVNLSTYYIFAHGYPIYWLDIPNITIVGTFIPTTSLKDYRIANGSTSFENYYFQFTDAEMAELEYEDLYGKYSSGSNTPLFGYSTFETDDHPFQQYYQNLNNSVGVKLPNLFYISGYGVTLNRDFTSFFNLLPPDRTVEIGLNGLRRSLPYSITVHNLIGEPLQELFEEANRLRIISQIINIPIIIVALIVGSFASKSATQGKVDEFLLLRSKGVAPRMVANQIVMEAFINGVVASVLGAGIGFLTFFGHDIWIRPMIYTQFVELDVTLFVKQSSILLSLGIGIILSLLTSLSSVVYVLKLDTSELLTAIEQKDMDLEFDEQSVFISLDKSTKKMRKSKREFKKEYKSSVEEKRKKVKKWSILYLSIGLLPLYYYLFITIAGGNATQNWLIELVEFSKSVGVFGYISMIFASAPILLAMAFIRMFTREVPVLFGRISRFFGKIFLKNKAYLMGLQMMKKKQYATVIMFLGVFSAIFVHLNVMAYSVHAHENVYSNYQIGSDLHVDFGFGTNVSSSEDFENLIHDLKSIKVGGENIVDDAMIAYQHRHSYYIQQYLHYVNLSNYLDFVLDGKKIMPDNDFIPSVLTLIDYNLNNPDSDIFPGAIVNQKYLTNNLLEIGDITYLNYRYYDSRLSYDFAFLYGYSIPVKIIAAVEFFPGVYVRPLDDSSALTPSEHIVVDTRDLPFQGVDYILHAPQVHVLINLNEDAASDERIIEDYLVDRTEDYYPGFSHGDYEFYIDKWSSIQSQESTNEINPQLVYKIGYLIFIVVLIQVALGLPILLASVRRKEQHFYGILLSRGFGRKGVFRFILSEIFVIYFLSIIGGIAVGLLSSTLTLLVGKATNPYMSAQVFRIFLNPIDLLVILGSVVGVSLLIFIIGFLYDTRKSISEYLTKF